ncbi:RIP metalloprotease RseP [Pelagibius sp. Alg239-R121]|uniref:RIP metalloprotease RseP n=1 Tax=Pelagibius sp. Alg239-R121 TaxID=2993448 RepID=UPI0024A6FB14|nr:RIP metalloprotease RseP [Pelagibius sp. Alg239-R121]
MEFLNVLTGTVFPFLVVLTVLVFVHEMGHYLIARKNGVRVEVFSIGFGPEIFGWTDRVNTRWKFSLIPLGGYVKMFGDADVASRPSDAPMTEEERQVSFQAKRLGQRAWIVAGGPLANFLLAIVIFAGLFMYIGQPFTPATVGEVIPDSAAAEAGFQPGDRIIRVDGSDVERFEELQTIVQLSAGRALEIDVLRDGAEIGLTAAPKPATQESFGSEQQIWRLGISRSGAEYKRHDPLTAVWRATLETVSVTGNTLKAVGQMITGDRSSKELGGPLRIAQMSGQVAEFGFLNLLSLLAILSVNLGLINLFPVPMLDGGHLFFYAIEALRGRPLGERAQEYGFRIGLALVLSLMVFATWNDLDHFGLF